MVAVDLSGESVSTIVPHNHSFHRFSELSLIERYIKKLVNAFKID